MPLAAQATKAVFRWMSSKLSSLLRFSMLSASAN